MAFNYKGVSLNYAPQSREGNAAQWAVDTYNQIHGRNPTAQEIAQALPSFLGGDPNITDIGAGNAFVASQKATADAATEQQKQQQTLADTQFKQSSDLATQQSATRAQRLQDLSKLLTGSANDLFSSTIAPATAEDANAKGIYTGTGYSEALARQKANLASTVQSQLSQQGLMDTDSLLGSETNATNAQQALYQSALQTSQGLNTAGLSRQFSLQDFANQGNMARTIASSLATPGGKTAAQTGGTIVNGLAGGVQAAAKGYAAFKGH